MNTLLLFAGAVAWLLACCFLAVELLNCLPPPGLRRAHEALAVKAGRIS